VVQKHSRPNHPTTCGKVERFHQTLKKWLRAQPRQPDTLLQALCNQFVAYYNSCRPHRSLNRQTPLAAYQARPKATQPARPKPIRSPASAAMWSTATANSPSATQAGCTTLASAEPTPEPLS
jgi:hypothetical protein